MQSLHSANPEARACRHFGCVLGLLVLMLCLAGVNASPPAPPPEPELTHEDLVDRFALGTPKTAESSLASLAAYLARPGMPERDKARALYRWMTDRVSYDVDAFFTGHQGWVRPDAVLRQRKALGQGYAALFEDLARRAGLYVVTIHGFAKIKHYTEEGRFQKVKHSWNAVWLDGGWQLLDAAWGAGYLKMQRFYKVYQEQYFLSPPTQMILTHFPSDPRWQLLQTPLTTSQFDALHPVDLRFFGVGFHHKTGVQGSFSPGLRSFFAKSETQLQIMAGSVKILTAPLCNPLAEGNVYHFVIEAPRGTPMAEVALLNNDQIVYMQKVGTRFEGVIRAEPGELKLCVKTAPDEPKYQDVMRYRVE